MRLFDLVRRTVEKAEAGVEKAVTALVELPFSRTNRNPAWGNGKINRGDRIVGRQVVAPDMQLPPWVERIGGDDEVF